MEGGSLVVNMVFLSSCWRKPCQIQAAKNLTQKSLFLLRGVVFWFMLKFSGFGTTQIFEDPLRRVFFFTSLRELLERVEDVTIPRPQNHLS
jgi:hypothetical protein